MSIINHIFTSLSYYTIIVAHFPSHCNPVLPFLCVSCLQLLLFIFLPSLFIFISIFPRLFLFFFFVGLLLIFVSAFAFCVFNPLRLHLACVLDCKPYPNAPLPCPAHPLPCLLLLSAAKSEQNSNKEMKKRFAFCVYAEKQPGQIKKDFGRAKGRGGGRGRREGGEREQQRQQQAKLMESKSTNKNARSRAQYKYKYECDTHACECGICSSISGI